MVSFSAKTEKCGVIKTRKDRWLWTGLGSSFGRVCVRSTTVSKWSIVLLCAQRLVGTCAQTKLGEKLQV